MPLKTRTFPMFLVQPSQSNVASQEQRFSFRQRKNFEDFLIVWLDADVNQTSYNQNAFPELRKNVNRLEIFDSIDECVDFISGIKDEKVFLIVSESFAEHVVPRIHLLSQLVSIYIFCSNVQGQQKLIQSFHKVKGVYHDIQQLADQIGRDRKISSNSLLGIKTMSHDSIDIRTSDLNRQEASFMYAQMLKVILLEFQADDVSKENMADICRKQYEDNQVQLKLIDEFIDTFTESNALSWYTRDCFLYRLLNKALRIQDADALYNMSYCLSHIDEQIKTRHAQWRLSHPDMKTLTVYRGYGMQRDDFEIVRNRIGGFMSISSFLSTSQDRTIAIGFAFPSIGLSDQVAVLLEIDIDVEKCKTPFADCQGESHFQEEREILFTMGAILRIESIQQDSSGIWIVRLNLTDEEDEELRTIAEHIRRDILNDDPMASLGKLMLVMGKYDIAEECYLLLLNDPDFIADLRAEAHVYNSLGSIYGETEQFDKALEHFEKSLEIYLKHYSATDPKLAPTYNNFGGIYYRQGDNEKALSYYNKALEADLSVSNPNQSRIALFYTNIGGAYMAQQRYTEALEIHEKSLQLKLEVLPSNHPDIGLSYYNISQVHYEQNNNSKAIEYIKKTLEIYLKTQPLNHPSLGKTYNHLALALYNQSILEEALEYMKKACDVDSKNFPLDYEKAVKNQEWIAMVEAEIEEKKMENKT